MNLSSTIKFSKLSLTISQQIIQHKSCGMKFLDEEQAWLETLIDKYNIDRGTLGYGAVDE